jgi:DNA-binding CsgD family transcriptional regulator
MKDRKTQHRMLHKGSAACAVNGEGIVVVDLTFKPIALDCGAEAILNDLEGEGDGLGCLPPKILTLLGSRSPSDLEAVYGYIDGDKSEYSCRASLIRPHGSTGVKPMLVVRLKREASVIDAVRQIGIDYRLTDREQETLMGVSMGLTSKELAERMNISPNTVKAFLRLIMIKMGVATRAGIVGKLLRQDNHNHGNKPNNGDNHNHADEIYNAELEEE